MVHILTNRKSGLLCRSRCWTWRLLSSFSSIGWIPVNESFREYLHWFPSSSCRFIRLSSSLRPGELRFGGNHRTTFRQFWCEEHSSWDSINCLQTRFTSRAKLTGRAIHGTIRAWELKQWSTVIWWSIWELFSVPMKIINKSLWLIRSYEWFVSMHGVRERTIPPDTDESSWCDDVHTQAITAQVRDLLSHVCLNIWS